MYHIFLNSNIIIIDIMSTFRVIFLILILITPVYGNSIYNLIKIPNLEIYEINKNPNMSKINRKYAIF